MEMMGKGDWCAEAFTSVWIDAPAVGAADEIGAIPWQDYGKCLPAAAEVTRWECPGFRARQKGDLTADLTLYAGGGRDRSCRSDRHCRSLRDRSDRHMRPSPCWRFRNIATHA